MNVAFPTPGTVARDPVGVHASYGVVPVRSGLEREPQRLGDVPRHDEAVGRRVAR